MAENSAIEWTTHTFNPWRGCTKVSAGCAGCYAETLSKRNPGTLGVWGPNGTRVVASESMWREPLKWDRAAKAAGERHRVFCASLADVFEDWSGPMSKSDEQKIHVGPASVGWVGEGHAPTTSLGYRPLTMQDVRQRLFDLIDVTPNLDWLLLTKRPENAFRMYVAHDPSGVMPDSIWLGTSVEDRKATARIDILRKIPAAVRFLSVEPLLEDLGTLDLTEIHWVIVGGESGHGARPMHPDWARSLRDQCTAAGVPFFMKQWGEYRSEFDLDVAGRLEFPNAVRCDGNNGFILSHRVGKKVAGRLLDGREWNEFPKPRKGS